MEILIIILFSTMILISGIFGQYSWFDSIDTDYFKKIKLKKFSFLFRSIGNTSVKKDGILIPLFIFQIWTYFLTIFSIIYGIIMISLDSNPMKTIIIILFSNNIIEVIIYIILSIISKKRKKY